MMLRTVTLTLALAGLAPLTTASAQDDALWRSVDISRQLRDSQPQRIRVQYAAGHVDVRASADPLLYALHLRYDERTAQPVHRYDADQRLAVLGVEARDDDGRSLRAGGRAGELRLALPRGVPLDLELTFGGAEAALELGGLMLQSARLECGATDATMSFSTPNRGRLRELEVNVGAAAFKGIALANANADQIRLHGGVGSVDLDLGGAWTRDLAVDAHLALGALTLRVPPEVGVRLEVRRVAATLDHTGLVKRGDAWYSDNWDTARYKLRVRAETFFGKIDLQRSVR